MSKNIYGGGAQTNANGLKFEQETDLETAFCQHPEYTVANDVLYKNNIQVGILAQKHKLYKIILDGLNIDYKNFISKKLLPDEALFAINSKTIYILEKKFQNCSGSVDEKLQTCDFKLMEYEKLFNPVGIKVKYVYILSDWFKKKEYTDVLEYIKMKNCYYFFNEIPLEFFNL